MQDDDDLLCYAPQQNHLIRAVGTVGTRGQFSFSQFFQDSQPYSNQGVQIMPDLLLFASLDFVLPMALLDVGICS